MAENVRFFIFNFRKAIKEMQHTEVQNMYEVTFPQLTDHYFDSCPWPGWREVCELVEHDKEFSILYKELYYRHIHVRMPGGPTLDERISAFYNYCDFFNLVLTANQPVQLCVPDIWLWEFIDGFISQFQNFSIYRSRLDDKTEDELVQLDMYHSNEWSILCVLNVLHSLIDISKIRQQLAAIEEDTEFRILVGDFGKAPLYKMLGYFSIIGLARVHSLLGDYLQVIKVLQPLGVHKMFDYSCMPACQVTISYHVGFAFMMMRRYVDAISIISECLLYMQNTKQIFSAQGKCSEQIARQMEQMYQLLAICLVLQPQRIEESLQQAMRDKNYHDAMAKMQAGDMGTFESLFVIACPKFLNACPPAVNFTMKDYSKEPLEHQLGIFLNEVSQQIKLPTIRSYLKVYCTLPLPKLTTFVSTQQTETCNDEQMLTELLCFKHKMHNVVRKPGSKGLDGKLTSLGEMDFYLDDEMIHIVDTKVDNTCSDFFFHKIAQLKEVNEKLRKIKL